MTQQANLLPSMTVRVHAPAPRPAPKLRGRTSTPREQCRRPRDVPFGVVVERPLPHEARERRPQPPHDLRVVLGVPVRGGGPGTRRGRSGGDAAEAEHGRRDVVLVRAARAHRAAVEAVGHALHGKHADVCREVPACTSACGFVPRRGADVHSEQLRRHGEAAQGRCGMSAPSRGSRAWGAAARTAARSCSARISAEQALLRCVWMV